MIGIYILTQRDMIVYVGQSTNIKARLDVHRTNYEYDAVYYRECNKSELDGLEKACINYFKPILNRYLSKTKYHNYSTKLEECRLRFKNITDNEFRKLDTTIEYSKIWAHTWLFRLGIDEPLRSVVNKIKKTPLVFRKLVIRSLRSRLRNGANYKYKEELLTILNKN